MAMVKEIWKIYQTSRGWHSSFGTLVLTPAPNADYTVRKFNVYESARHDIYADPPVARKKSKK